MQQTEKYKLNLIEPSDPFLPDALNANTQQLEQVVSQHLEDMDQRVTVLENFKIAYGTYRSTVAPPFFIPLPFTPRYVFISHIARGTSREYIGIAVDAEGGNLDSVKIAEGGFIIEEDFYSSLYSGTYGYLAFG